MPAACQFYDLPAFALPLSQVKNTAGKEAKTIYTTL
jgi:hypothetical protein